MTVNAATMTVPSVGILTAKCHLTVTVHTVILAIAQRVTITVIAVIPVLPCGFVGLGPIAGVVGAINRMAIAGTLRGLGRVARSGGGQYPSARRGAILGQIIGFTMYRVTIGKFAIFVTTRNHYGGHGDRPRDIARCVP